MFRIDKTPCYQCENRQLGCHGTCETYQQFFAARRAAEKTKGIADYAIAERNRRRYDSRVKYKKRMDMK